MAVAAAALRAPETFRGAAHPISFNLMMNATPAHVIGGPRSSQWKILARVKSGSRRPLRACLAPQPFIRFLAVAFALRNQLP